MYNHVIRSQNIPCDPVVNYKRFSEMCAGVAEREREREWWLNLLSKGAVRYGLSTELNLQCVGARLSRRVHDTDGPVAVVDDVNIDVALDIAANTTGDSTLTSLRRVQVNDALFTNRDRRAYGVCVNHTISSSCVNCRIIRIYDCGSSFLDWQ